MKHADKIKDFTFEEIILYHQRLDEYNLADVYYNPITDQIGLGMFYAFKDAQYYMVVDSKGGTVKLDSFSIWEQIGSISDQL